MQTPAVHDTTLQLHRCLAAESVVCCRGLRACVPWQLGQLTPRRLVTVHAAGLGVSVYISLELLLNTYSGPEQIIPSWASIVEDSRRCSTGCLSRNECTVLGAPACAYCSFQSVAASCFPPATSEKTVSAGSRDQFMH